MNQNTKQVIKNSFIWAVVFSLTVLWFGLAYWAWTSISSVNTWDSLTATKWNELVTRLNSINEKSLATAWVSFNGNSCTWGVWANECTIRDSYNINKVIRLSTWTYRATFENNMSNTNYIISWSAVWSTNTWYNSLIVSNWIVNDLSYFEFRTININSTLYNLSNVMVVLNWWKTY